MTQPTPQLGPARDPARMAGLFLIATAVTTAAAVATRVAADTDQPTLAESLAAIAQNPPLYEAAGAARFASGLALAAAAWYLSKVVPLRQRQRALLAPVLFAGSGAATAISGVCAVALAVSVIDLTAPITPDSMQETLASVRTLTGKIGFAMAGLGVVAVGLRQRTLHAPILRRIAIPSIATGIAMQLIWIDAATLIHRVTGPAFFLWLLALGIVLFTGRVDRDAGPETTRDAPEGRT